MLLMFVRLLANVFSYFKIHIFELNTILWSLGYFVVVFCHLCSSLSVSYFLSKGRMFWQVSGPGGCADQQHHSALLQELIQVPRQLGEVAAFRGSNVEPSVASCFRMAPGKTSIQLSHFLEWMSLELQSVVWLSVLQRVVQAENA
uniref:dystrophin-related protein 2-like n=1 Tax=Oncorhynchus gorbuscha TaxID=8017 RepID=UPI001EAE9132|nr:dystrophin-related protein 2-like [Oncorhynchus gorbuscha]